VKEGSDVQTDGVMRITYLTFSSERHGGQRARDEVAEVCRCEPKGARPAALRRRRTLGANSAGCAMGPPTGWVGAPPKRDELGDAAAAFARTSSAFDAQHLKLALDVAKREV